MAFVQGPQGVVEQDRILHGVLGIPKAIVAKQSAQARVFRDSGDSLLISLISALGPTFSFLNTGQ